MKSDILKGLLIGLLAGIIIFVIVIWNQPESTCPMIAGSYCPQGGLSGLSNIFFFLLSPHSSVSDKTMIFINFSKFLISGIVLGGLVGWFYARKNQK